MKASKIVLGISLFIFSLNSHAFSEIDTKMITCAAYADVTARDAIMYPMISGKPAPISNKDYTNIITTSRMHLVGVAKNTPLPDVVSKFKQIKGDVSADSAKKTGYKTDGRTFNINYLIVYMEYNARKFTETCSPLISRLSNTASAYGSEKALSQAALDLKEEFKKQGLEW